MTRPDHHCPISVEKYLKSVISFQVTSFVVFDTGSCYEARLALSSQSFCLSLLSDEITSMGHHIRQ
jgi:hypothetical protein